MFTSHSRGRAEFARLIHDERAFSETPGESLATCIDIYRDNYLETLGVRSEVEWEEYAGPQQEAGSHGYGEKSLGDDFRASRFFPHSGRLAKIPSAALPSDNRFFRANDIRAFTHAPYGLSSRKSGDYYLLSGLMIVSLIQYAKSQFGWNVVFQTEMNESLRDYFDLFKEQKRPFYLGACNVQIHGVLFHPYEALLHDLYHLLVLVQSFSFSGRQHHKQVEDCEKVFKVLSDLNMKNIGPTESFPGNSLLSLLIEGIPLDIALQQMARTHASELHCFLRAWKERYSKVLETTRKTSC